MSEQDPGKGNAAVESTLPLVLYIPGLLPKPEMAVHKDALLRCLLAGLERVAPDVASDVRSHDGVFDIVSWTYEFYNEHRDIALDAAAIAAVAEQPEATEQDIDEATSWSRRLLRHVYKVGDRLPFLIRHLASEKVTLHLRDLSRYLRNRHSTADHARLLLKQPLRAAAASGRPVLLLAHSMGSIIAYDSLWEMTHEDDDELQLDLLLTMGSPLGQRYLQKRIKGHALQGKERYPANIRRWLNLSAHGDMTSLDPSLADDFAEMIELGLIDRIEDGRMYNYFRLDGVLNPHAEYGYLANDVTAAAVADWWRQATASNATS